MGFTPKDWVSEADHAGPPASPPGTPISGASLEDLETRVTDYTDLHGAATSVKDSAYGATGDGSTDDTTAFESARTGAGVGGHVYVPPGTYVLDTVNLTLAAQRWTLAPGAILKLKNSSATAKILSLEAERIIVEGGELNGNKANQSVSGQVGLIHIGATGCRVYDVYAHDGSGFAIRSETPAAGTAINDIEVRGVRAIDCLAGGVFFYYGVEVGQTPPSVPSKGARIINCYSDNSATAAVDIIGGGHGVHCPDGVSAANMPQWVVVEGCFAKSRTDAVVVAGLGVTNCRQVSIVGCQTVAQSWSGYTIIQNEDFNITGCSDFGSLYGYELGGNPGLEQKGTITGCSVNGNGVTEQGIVLDNCSHTAVMGCSIRGLKSDAGTGIIMHNGDESEHTRLNAIVGNTIEFNDRGIQDQDYTAGNQTIIANNTILATGAGDNFGIHHDWTSSVTRSVKRYVHGNLLVNCVVGINWVNGNVARTFSDCFSRMNHFASCTSNYSKDANITFDATCSIEDEALLGWAV